MEFKELRQLIIDKLKRELPANLFYHNVKHTLLVLEATEEICRMENIGESDTLMLRTAALFHDIGFIRRYLDNEPIGAEMAAEILPDCGYNENQIAVIKRLILATAMPRNPKDHLEKIICDADMDYLGSDDYFSMSQKLKLEWGYHWKKLSLTEWYAMEFNFLESHIFFTDSEYRLREKVKIEHKNEIKVLLDSLREKEAIPLRPLFTNNLTNQEEIVAFLKEVTIFSHSGENLLELVSSRLVKIDVEEGETLFHKGNQGESMYFIYEGTMIIHDGEYKIAELGKHDFFGEFSLLDTEKRSASVTASTEGILYRLGQEDFFKMIEFDPGLSAELFRALIKRFRSHNHKIIEEYKHRQVKLEATIIERTKDIQKEKEIADQQRKRAEQSEKFKQQFLANMSHEIRTPMNSIVGLSNLLINSPMNDQQKKYLNVIRKSSDNLLVIINDILDLSKIQAGKMEFETIPFLMHEVLETVYHTLRFKAEDKGLAFSFELDESVPKVLMGDPVRLNQVLINIIGNAIKFTEKGFVKFVVDVEEYTNQIVSLPKNKKNKKEEGKQIYRLQFSVIDSGIGMNEEQQKKVFESFSQASSDTTRKYGGTGLGLTISKQLVESQGGTIGLKSEPGKGTTFYFLMNFPLGSMEEIEKKEMGSTEDFVKHLSGMKILLVEDNPFNQMVAEDTIKESIPDIIIEIADNGKIALDMISKNDYDLVLMDINMPEMDGYDATKNIRQMPAPKNKLPIIAMTASVTKEEIDKCFASGMNEYVPKPFQPQDLLMKMKNLRGKV